MKSVYYRPFIKVATASSAGKIFAVSIATRTFTRSEIEDFVAPEGQDGFEEDIFGGNSFAGE